MVMKECIKITEHSLFTLLMCGGWMQLLQRVWTIMFSFVLIREMEFGNDLICDSWAAGTIKVNRLIVMGLLQPCLAYEQTCSEP